MSIMLSCLKATELIEKKNFLGLTGYEKMKLFFHKSMCSACAAYEKQSRLLDKILREKSDADAHKEADKEENAELKARIISRLP